MPLQSCLVLVRGYHEKLHPTAQKFSHLNTFSRSWPLILVLNWLCTLKILPLPNSSSSMRWKSPPVSTGIFFTQWQCFTINFCKCLKKCYEYIFDKHFLLCFRQFLALSIYQGSEAKYKDQDSFLNHLKKF